MGIQRRNTFSSALGSSIAYMYVSLSLHISVYLYFFLSVSLSVHLRQFLVIKRRCLNLRAAHAFVDHGVGKPLDSKHKTLYNYPRAGVQRTPVGFIWDYISVYRIAFLSSCLHHFLAISCATQNWVQRIWPQVTESNPLSGSIICTSIYQSGHP